MEREKVSRRSWQCCLPLLKSLLHPEFLASLMLRPRPFLKRHTLALLLLLQALVTSVTALPEQGIGLIERHIREEMELNQIPGLALSIVHSGQVFYSQGFGVRDLSTAKTMTVDTPVELASLSKSLTALAILLLQAEGQIELASPVRRYLPELEAASPLLATTTIGNLLAHRSGLTRQADRLLPCCGMPGDLDLRGAVLRLQGARLDQRPGGYFVYANSNYVLLAAVVESVSGTPFPVFMRERIFLPLGMQGATLDLEKARSHGLAPLHELRWGKVRVSPSRYRGWLGSSAVKASASDLSQYMIALLDDDHPFAQLIASAKLSQETTGYNMGWEIGPEDTSVLRHGGNIWGANSAIILAPNLQLGAVVLINAGLHRAEEIVEAVFAYLCGKEAPPPAVQSWTLIPDNWAILLTTLGAVVFVSTLGYCRRAWTQLRRGERKFGGRLGFLKVARTVLFAFMTAALIHLALGGSGPPRASLPTTIQVAFPFFASSMAGLFVALAVFNLAPVGDLPASPGGHCRVNVGQGIPRRNTPSDRSA